MLLDRDYHDKNCSKYKCDRCGIKMYSKEKTSFAEAKAFEGYTKLFDLCDECRADLNEFLRGER